jgi:hypothetical protein
MGRREISRQKLLEKYGPVLADVKAGLSIRQAALNHKVSPSHAQRVLRRLGYEYKLVRVFVDGTEDGFDSWR